MRATVKKITDLTEKYNMFRPGMKVLCAVSGGADSMCLLHWLNAEKEALGIYIAAAHYEHGIRGKESLRDCRFVESYCRENGIELLTEHGAVPQYAAQHSLSIEEAARELRYTFLSRAARQLGCDVIATAHNLNDNAETVLFHLARGGGAEGLSGIPPVRGNIVRPLLALSREEIEQYLKEHDVAYVEDSTNASDQYSRNSIRHRVVPVLNEINPVFAEAVFRTSCILREDEECLSSLAEKFLTEYFDGASVPLEEFCALHTSVAARVVRGLCPQQLSRRHVEEVLKIAQQQELQYADVPGLRIRAEQGRLYFTEDVSLRLPERELIPGTELLLPEAGLKILSEFSVYHGEVHDLFNTLYLSCDEIYGRISVGARCPGDSLRIRGRGCSKTLKKLFTENGYPQQKRNLTPVLRDEKGLLAVYGLAAAERTEPHPGSPVLKITFRKLTGEENGQSRK